MSLRRPLSQALNGKLTDSYKMQSQQEPSSPTHNDDLVKFINESWNKVSREFEHCSSQNGSESKKSGPSVRYFVDEDVNPQLKDFEPFDLDAWWGKKVVQNLQRTQSS